MSLARTLFAFTLVQAAVVVAHTDMGSIHGTVTDPRGDYRPQSYSYGGNVATGIKANAATTDAGHYDTPVLSAGMSS